MRGVDGDGIEGLRTLNECHGWLGATRHWQAMSYHASMSTGGVVQR